MMLITVLKTTQKLQFCISLSNKKIFYSSCFPTIVFSGNFDGHQLFNEDEVLLHTRDILSGRKHGSRI